MEGASGFSQVLRRLYPGADRAAGSVSLWGGAEGGAGAVLQEQGVGDHEEHVRREHGDDEAGDLRRAADLPGESLLLVLFTE